MMIVIMAGVSQGLSMQQVPFTVISMHLLTLSFHYPMRWELLLISLKKNKL